MVRPGFKEASQKEVISELGIFGYIIGGEENKLADFSHLISVGKILPVYCENLRWYA